MENMVVDHSFWKNRNVFITGHTGFKGGWLSLWLQNMGSKVSGFALVPPTQPNLFSLAKVSDGMTSHIGDIRNPAEITTIIQKEQPEIIIHMAAQAIVRDSYNDPVTTYSTNVMGTVNVLEAARETDSVKVVLNITSDKCYENQEWLRGYREDDPMGGYDPYSSSKGCAEIVVSAYRRSFFSDSNVAIATARAGNVLGGGDWAKDRIVPDAIKAFIDKQPLTIRNPSAVRPWQHVLDPLSGYLILCQKLYEKPDQFSESWNFGPLDEDTQPVSVIADMLATNWGDGASWTHDDDDHPHETHHLKLDCSKSKNLLGWRPTWSIQNALKETISWYKSWHLGHDMHKFTIDQIAVYQK